MRAVELKMKVAHLERKNRALRHRSMIHRVIQLQTHDALHTLKASHFDLLRQLKELGVSLASLNSKWRPPCASNKSNKKLQDRLAAEKMAGAGQAAGRSGDVAGVADAPLFPDAAALCDAFFHIKSTSPNPSR